MGKCYNSKWDKIIARAKTIALSYDTPVTLRQLFYRLVAAQLILNNQSSYNQLSALTAQGRRDGTFPELIDTGRSIEEPRFFDSPADAIRDVRRWYRSDRLADQQVSVYLGVEKRGLVAQLGRLVRRSVPHSDLAAGRVQLSIFHQRGEGRRCPPSAGVRPRGGAAVRR
jgi:hypothetical protein